MPPGRTGIDPFDSYRWIIINLRGENTIQDFLEFHPDDLSVVNSKKRQVDLWIDNNKVFNPGQVSSQVPISHLAPGAFVEISYSIDVFKEPSIMVYFGDKLLAEITSSPLEPKENYN